MSYALGFAALFLGAAIVITGFEGGGVSKMNSNFISLLKGTWPFTGGPAAIDFTGSGGGNASTGGAYSPPAGGGGAAKPATAQ